MMENIKRTFTLGTWILLPLIALPHQAEGRPPIIQILMEASRSIVAIQAENGAIRKADGKARAAKWTRRGAGILIHETGLIASNAHTIRQAARLTVILADQSVHPAKVVFLDSANDLALLKISAAAPLPSLRLADSDRLPLNSKVYSIGNSALLKNTLSEGKLTGIGVPRTNSGKEKTPRPRILQVSFNVYPGDSGTPVLDDSGSVVGIISGGMPRRGKTAFAIPSNFISQAFSGVTGPPPSQKGSSPSQAGAIVPYSNGRP